MAKPYTDPFLDVAMPGLEKIDLEKVVVEELAKALN